MVKTELSLNVLNSDELRNMSTEEKMAWAIAFNEEQERLRNEENQEETNQE